MLRIKDTPYKMVLLTEGEFYQNIFLFCTDTCIVYVI